MSLLSPREDSRSAATPQAPVSRRRLTVEIGSDLHRRLRLRALHDGETLASMVVAILHEHMDHWEGSEQPRLLASSHGAERGRRSSNHPGRLS